MANAVVYGFRPVRDESYKAPVKYAVAASQTIVIGDPVSLDSAGRVIVATATSAFMLGVAASAVTVSSVGDPIYVWDNPEQVFEGMVSTGALADTYTTRSAAACFDLAGSTGAFYVNSAASSYNIFKVVGVSKDPVTGADSAFGTNTMELVKIASAVHVYGTIS